MKVSVVVANHGRDLTLLRKSIPKKKSIEIVEIDIGKERSEQRNIGIKKAKGEYILLLDSDQSISPGLIKECLKLAREGYETLYIPEIICAEGWFAEIRRFERFFYTGTRVDVPRFFKRKGCPLFNLELTGPEDADWGNRLPEKRAITKNPLFHHDSIDPIEYFKKKAYYTKSMARYKELWPDDPVLKFRYRCWTVFTENSKWRCFFRHPVLALGVYLIIFVRGIIYLKYR